MNLLVIDPNGETYPWLQRLFRRQHRLILCRGAREAVFRLETGALVDGVALCGSQTEEEQLLRHLEVTANPPPVILRVGNATPRKAGAYPSSPRPAPGRRQQAPRLTRLELHRLLVEPGGACEDEDLVAVHRQPLRKRR